MRCPFCTSTNLKVLESRVVEEDNAIRRRRKCTKCKRRFSTIEKIKGHTLWVIKNSGYREAFDKEKIKKGILRAVEKRPVSIESVDNIADQIERELIRKQKDEVESGVIGRAVLRRLKSLDMVAWLRFASVYLKFDDIKDFEEAIKSL